MGFLAGCEEEAEAFVVARREFLGFVADFLEAGDEGLGVGVVFDAVIVDLAEGLVGGVQEDEEFGAFDVDFSEGGLFGGDFGEGGGVNFLVGGVFNWEEGVIVGVFAEVEVAFPYLVAEGKVFRGDIFDFVVFEVVFEFLVIAGVRFEGEDWDSGV